MDHRDLAVELLKLARAAGAEAADVLVAEGTEFSVTVRKGEVEIPSMERYASWVADAIERLDPAILIHRFTGHSPRRLTVAPEWSVNKLAVMNAVEAELVRRDAWQGKALGCGRPEA